MIKNEVPFDIYEGNRIIIESPFLSDVHKNWLNHLMKVEKNSEKLLKDAQYHSQIHWILPILLNIEKLRHGTFSYDSIIGLGNTCTIIQYGNLGRKTMSQKWESTHSYTNELGPKSIEAGTWVPGSKIQAIWVACIKFIKWYNENIDK